MKWTFYWVCSLVFLLACSSLLSANPIERNVDKIAHATVTYSIIVTSYALCKQHWKELSNGECLTFSYAGGVLAGALKEQVWDGRGDGWDYLANTTGVGLSIPVIIFGFK